MVSALKELSVHCGKQTRVRQLQFLAGKCNVSFSTACLGKAPSPKAAGRQEMPEGNPELVGINKVRKCWEGRKGRRGVCAMPEAKGGARKAGASWLRRPTCFFG